MAPPPSAEVYVKLVKPFSGTAVHTIEIIGEVNRPATIKRTHHHGDTIEEKTGEMPQ